MGLSLSGTITVRDLRGVRDFYPGPMAVGSKSGKVFLLEGAEDTKLVIKDDAVFQPQIKSASFAMKAVHRNSRAKLLSPVEVQQLKEFVRLYFDLRRDFQSMGLDYRPEIEEDMGKLRYKLDDRATTFHKMEVQDVQDIQGALEKRLNGDKSQLRGFAAVLAGPNGLESLGEIIAVDLFNGNTDRFFPRGWDPTVEQNLSKRIGGMVFDFRALVNPKNVFRALNGPSPVSGLDFLDPQSSYKNMRDQLNEEFYNYKWPARVMLDPRKLTQFAEDVVHDLELLLNPHRSRFSRRTKLGKNRKGRLISGMKSGMRKIKMRMEQKYPVRTMPAAIKERYDVLNAIR